MTGLFSPEAAAEATHHWGDPTSAPRPITVRHVCSAFDVSLADGRRVLLRLFPNGSIEPAALDARCRWTEALADAGFACPWPQRTRRGELVNQTGTDGPLVTAEQWINGTTLNARSIDDGDLHAVGALLADLHLTTDAVHPETPPALRHEGSTDVGRLALAAGDIGPLASRPEVRDLFEQACDAAIQRVATIPSAEWGLVHGNARLENFLAFGDDLFLIGFLTGTHGPRAGDLAGTLSAFAEHPDWDAKRDALLSGYRDAGGFFDAKVTGPIEMFLFLQSLAELRFFVSISGQPNDAAERKLSGAALRFLGAL